MKAWKILLLLPMTLLLSGCGSGLDGWTTNVNGMTSIVIYSNGSSRFLYEVILGVSAIFSESISTPGNVLPSMLATGFLISFLLSSFKSLFGGKHDFQGMLMAALLFAFLFLPRVNVTIEDYDSSTFTPGVVHATYNVSGIPIGIAVAGWITSNLGRDLTELFEVAFTTPSMSSYGALAPLKVLAAVDDSSNVMDVVSHSENLADFDYLGYDLQFTLDNYMENCVMPAIADGHIKPEDLYSSTDALTTIEVPFSGPAWQFVSKLDRINTASTGNITACNTGYALIVSELTSNTFENAQLNVIKDRAVLENNSDAEDIFSQLAGSGLTLAQNHLSRMLQYHMKSNEVMQNAGIVVSSAEYNSLRSAQIDRASDRGAFFEAARSMMAFIEALIFFAAPLLAFALALGSIGVTMLGTYLKLAIWVATWPIAMSIVNLYTYLSVSEVISNRLYDPALGAVAPEMMNKWSNLDMIYSSAESWIATSGQLTAMVPMLTFALLTGSAYSLSKIADRMGTQDANLKKLSPDMTPDFTGGTNELANTQTRMTGASGAYKGLSGNTDATQTPAVTTALGTSGTQSSDVGSQVGNTGTAEVTGSSTTNSSATGGLGYTSVSSNNVQQGNAHSVGNEIKDTVATGSGVNQGTNQSATGTVQAGLQIGSGRSSNKNKQPGKPEKNAGAGNPAPLTGVPGGTPMGANFAGGGRRMAGGGATSGLFAQASTFASDLVGDITDQVADTYVKGYELLHQEGDISAEQLSEFAGSALNSAFSVSPAGVTRGGVAKGFISKKNRPSGEVDNADYTRAKSGKEGTVASGEQGNISYKTTTRGGSTTTSAKDRINGTSVLRTENKDGSLIEMRKNADGSTVAYRRSADGSERIVKRNADGSREVTAFDKAGDKTIKNVTKYDKDGNKVQNTERQNGAISRNIKEELASEGLAGVATMGLGVGGVLSTLNSMASVSASDQVVYQDANSLGQQSDLREQTMAGAVYKGSDDVSSSTQASQQSSTNGSAQYGAQGSQSVSAKGAKTSATTASARTAFQSGVNTALSFQANLSQAPLSFAGMNTENFRTAIRFGGQMADDHSTHANVRAMMQTEFAGLTQGIASNMTDVQALEQQAERLEAQIQNLSSAGSLTPEQAQTMEDMQMQLQGLRELQALKADAAQGRLDAARDILGAVDQSSVVGQSIVTNANNQLDAIGASLSGLRSNQDNVDMAGNSGLNNLANSPLAARMAGANRQAQLTAEFKAIQGALESAKSQHGFENSALISAFTGNNQQLTNMIRNDYRDDGHLSPSTIKGIADISGGFINPTDIASLAKLTGYNAGSEITSGNYHSTLVGIGLDENVASRMTDNMMNSQAAAQFEQGVATHSDMLATQIDDVRRASSNTSLNNAQLIAVSS